MKRLIAAASIAAILTVTIGFTFDGTTWREEFTGTPPSPLVFDSMEWHTAVDISDYHAWANGYGMPAQHGPDCSAPPDTHMTSGFTDAVFICNNHMMTALAGYDTYAALYLTPAAMLDWSGGEATFSWDMSTLQMSGRDWPDVWITPPSDYLMFPLEDTSLSFQGPPRNAIAVRWNFTAGLSTWALTVFRDGQVAAHTLLPTGITPSSTVRSPFSLTVSSNQITLRSGTEGVSVPVGLPGTTAMAQLGHHSYNPEKDNSGVAATWHWDNVQLSPSKQLSFTRVSPQRTINEWQQTLDGTVRTLTFSGAAPAGATLAFGAVCQVDLNWGSGWQRAAKMVDAGKPETASSYQVAVPEGATSVQVRFAGDSWFAGFPCILEHPLIYAAGGGGGGSSPSPTVAVPTATAIPPTATNTVVPPTATVAPPTATPTPRTYRCQVRNPNGTWTTVWSVAGGGQCP